jgi:hypothetical protein
MMLASIDGNRQTAEPGLTATCPVPDTCEQLNLFDSAGAEAEDDRKPGAVWNGAIWVSDDDLPEGIMRG